LGDRPGSPDGETRLVRYVIDHHDQPLEGVMDGIFAAADEPSDAPPDDRTLLILRG
jgi:hypothetical protein